MKDFYGYSGDFFFSRICRGSPKIILDYFLRYFLKCFCRKILRHWEEFQEGFLIESMEYLLRMFMQSFLEESWQNSIGHFLKDSLEKPWYNYTISTATPGGSSNQVFKE